MRENIHPYIIIHTCKSPLLPSNIVIITKQPAFVKKVTSAREEPCSNTLSCTFGRKASATTLIDTSVIPYEWKFGYVVKSAAANIIMPIYRWDI